jgi:hypothetical protein
LLVALINVVSVPVQYPLHCAGYAPTLGSHEVAALSFVKF